MTSNIPHCILACVNNHFRKYLVDSLIPQSKEIYEYSSVLCHTTLDNIYNSTVKSGDILKRIAKVLENAQVIYNKEHWMMTDPQYKDAVQEMKKFIDDYLEDCKKENSPIHVYNISDWTH